MEKNHTDENDDVVSTGPNQTPIPVPSFFTPERIVLMVYGLLIALGIGTGYLLSRKSVSGSLGGKPTMVKTSTVAGITDTETFKDWAVGVIEKDGMGNEGTHKLIREGGPSQTVCLISSVLDLDEYLGKKVKVWGKTEAAKTCAWLMDVGKIELGEQ